MSSLLKMARAEKAIHVLGAVLGVLLFSLSLLSQVRTGTISGVVQDTSGAVIAGAMFTVRNVDTGVVSVGAGQASAAFDFGTGTRFNVNGSRAYANTFLLDGTDIADHANGTPGGSAGTNLGVDGVQEFKINTSVSQAEYGRSSGGVISAVTRSGTNSLHGSAFEFDRNNAVASLAYLRQSTPA